MNSARPIDWQVIEPDRVAPTPWRNGGGVTRELLAWPGTGDWRVRISIAEVVQDGPFSRFDGVERWFAVLEGAGVHLQVDGVTQTLTPTTEPFSFSGDAQVHCSLVDGPTKDLNLMAPPGAARMLRVSGSHRGVISARCLVAVYAPEGGAITVYDEDAQVLAPRALTWRLLDRQGPMIIEGAVIWMEVKL